VDRELTPEQRAFQLAVRDFAEDVVPPGVTAREGPERFPVDVVRRMGELGLFGLPFPSRYGGLDGGFLTFCVCLEELGRVDASVALVLASAVCRGANAIFRLGDEEQRQRWLAPMARGRSIGALAAKDGGDGAGTPGATVRLEAGAWVLDGGSGSVADVETPLTRLCVVAAWDEDAGGVSPIVVPVDAPGFAPGARRGAPGAHGSGTRDVALAGCRVPLDHLLGERGGGEAPLVEVLGDARVAEAAVATGHALGRLGEGEVVTAVRSAYRAAARLRDRGSPSGVEAATAGLLADRIWGS